MEQRQDLLPWGQKGSSWESMRRMWVEMSPTLPQPAPLQVQTLEAGKGLARLAQAEQCYHETTLSTHQVKN